MAVLLLLVLAATFSGECTYPQLSVVGCVFGVEQAASVFENLAALLSYATAVVCLLVCQSVHSTRSAGVRRSSRHGKSTCGDEGQYSTVMVTGAVPLGRYDQWAD